MNQRLKSLKKKTATKLPAEVLSPVRARDSARATKDWQKADDLRKQIEKLGFSVKDTSNGAPVFKKASK